MAEADEIINPNEEPETPEVVEPEAPEEPEVEAPEEPDGSEEPEEEPEEKPLSRRQQLRLQQLYDRITNGESPDAPSQPPKPSPEAFNYDDLDADPELINQFKTDRQRAQEEGYSRGLEQAKSIQFQTRLEIDAPRVETKYPMLDKNSDEFNPALADTVNRMYLSAVGFDARTGHVKTLDLRYGDFIDGLFELSDEMGRRKVESSKRNIASQASKTAIRPGGSRPAKLDLTKAPEEMTDQELRAYLRSQGL